MIRHIIMIRFKERAGGRGRAENAAVAKAMLEELPRKIGWIRSLTVGLNAPDAAEGNWDLVMDSTFDSMEDLARYQTHPDHVAVGEFMRPLREERACVDFAELPGGCAP